MASWFGLFLATVGLFKVWWIAIGTTIVTGIVVMTLLHYSNDFPSFQRIRLAPGKWLAVGGLILFSTVVLFPGFEYIDGGRDPGTYVNAGILVAKTGGIPQNDDVANNLTAAAAQLLFHTLPAANAPERFLGFQFAEDHTGRIIPQFMHMFPMWLASAYSLGGIFAIWLVTPAFGVAAIISVYFAGRAMFSEYVGILAAILLTLNPVQIWFARYPVAEALSLFLLFGGLACFAKYVKTGSVATGILAGSAIATLPLVRADLFLVTAIVVPFAIWEYWSGRLSTFWAFLAPHILISASALLYMVFLTPVYFRYLHGNFNLVQLAIFLLLLAAATFGAAGAMRKLGFRRERVSRDRTRLWLATVSAGLIAVVGIYSFVLRPGGGAIPPEFEPGFDYGSWNLVRLSWFVGWPILILAVLGWFLVVRSRLNRSTALFLAIALAFAVVYIDDARIYPELMWAMRRYLPVVIPSLVLLASFALVKIWHSPRWRLPARALAVGMIVIAGLNVLPTSLILWPHREHSGLAGQIEQFRTNFTEDDILLFAEDYMSSIVGLPMWTQYGYHSFGVYADDLEGLESQIEVWRGEGRRVFLITDKSDYHANLSGFHLRRATVKTFQWMDLERTFDRTPLKVDLPTPTLTVHEVLLSKSIRGREPVAVILDRDVPRYRVGVTSERPG